MRLTLPVRSVSNEASQPLVADAPQPFVAERDSPMGTVLSLVGLKICFQFARLSVITR